MNKKIFKLLSFCLADVKKIFNSFGPDKYGSWTFSVTGHGGQSSINANSLWVRHWYNGNGGWTHGDASASRSIEKLKKAKKISFSFQTQNWGNGNAYLSLESWWVFDICGVRIASVRAPGGSQVTFGGFAQQGTFNVVLTQKNISINNTVYEYPNNWRLKDSTQDSLYVQAYPWGSCAGYAFEADMRIYAPGLITVKW